MKLRDLTADDLGKRVVLRAPVITVTGTLEMYGHSQSDLFLSHQGSVSRPVIDTSVTIAGHDFTPDELEQADIEVLP